jgi:hypothetical protein
MQLTGTEFTQLIADVEKEFGAYLAKAESTNVAASEQVLSKSFDEADKEPKKDEEKKDEPKAESSKPEEKQGEEKKPEQKEDAQEGESQPEQRPEEQGSEEAEGEGHGYDDEDMNHMHEMYGSMNKHELKAHHDSIRSALDKCMGMDKQEAPMEQAAPAPAPMAKSEVSIEIPVVSPELDLVKSELAAEKAKSDELKKNFDIVAQILSKLVKKGAPQAKAVTSVETLAKSETTHMTNLSQVQITEALTRKAKDPSLSKADRDAINAYYLSGTSITTINHLLK